MAHPAGTLAHKKMVTVFKIPGRVHLTKQANSRALTPALLPVSTLSRNHHFAKISGQATG
jgi:hypothetical protein